ncbi:MAG: polysaccharide deacetylase family protein [Actinobacteria bacterium]|nr:polysaccharide deacetylase family protein [Actinomycetota bacterium]
MAAPLPLADAPPPIHVGVGSLVRSLSPGVTAGELAAAEGLRPKPGDFVDVENVVLEAGRFPGHLTINGEPAEPAVALRDGDRLAAVDGKDRTEGTLEHVVRIPGGRVANPQASLATAPGEQVITRGRISGKVVSSVFRPTGPYRAPLEVALTFDDGPSATYTPKILDILGRMKVKATFFVVGTMVERFPELLRREAAMGMAIGNHTYGHPLGGAFAGRPKQQIRGEIQRMQRLLHSFGVEPIGFRPPGGSWSDFVRDAALDLGMRTVLWAVDSRDWTRPAVTAIVMRVMSNVRPGSIILLHDGGGDRSATVAALPRIIRQLRARGLEPVTLT